MLAPSKEALDAPLSPPPLDDEPGPATGLSGDYPDGTHTRWFGPAFRTHQSPNLNLTDSLLDALSALLDGPATARALANRLQRPIAAVRYSLDQLLTKNLVVTDGCEQIGGITEQLYRLPAGELTINLDGGLPVALKRVQRGIEAADRLGLPATASLVAVRLSPEKVEELLNTLARLRDEAEGYNLQEGQGRRFNLFLAGWGGE